MKGMHYRVFLNFLFVFVGVLLFGGEGCEQTQQDSVTGMGGENPSPPVVQETKTSAFSEGKEAEWDAISKQKIIYTCYLYLGVENVDDAFRRAQEIVRQYQGYLSRVERNQYYGQRTGRLNVMIRVPVTHFDTVVSELRRMAKHELNYRVESSDVTEEYIDIQARLKVKRELENQYRNLLRQAKSVKDVLEVQRELSTVRSEIESIEGRLKYLQNQTDYATIHLDLEEYVVSELPIQVGFWDRLKEGFQEGWKLLLITLVGIVTLWPFWALIGIGFFFWRYYRRRTKRTKAPIKNENES